MSYEESAEKLMRDLGDLIYQLSQELKSHKGLANTYERVLKDIAKKDFKLSDQQKEALINMFGDP